MAIFHCSPCCVFRYQNILKERERKRNCWGLEDIRLFVGNPNTHSEGSRKHDGLPKLGSKQEPLPVGVLEVNASLGPIRRSKDFKIQWYCVEWVLASGSIGFLGSRTGSFHAAAPKYSLAAQLNPASTKDVFVHSEGIWWGKLADPTVKKDTHSRCVPVNMICLPVTFPFMTSPTVLLTSPFFLLSGQRTKRSGIVRVCWPLIALYCT